MRNRGQFPRVSAPSRGVEFRYTSTRPLLSRLATDTELRSLWIRERDAGYQSTAPPDGKLACFHPAGAGVGTSQRNGLPAYAAGTPRQRHATSARPETIPFRFPPPDTKVSLKPRRISRPSTSSRPESRSSMRLFSTADLPRDRRARGRLGQNHHRRENA